MSIRANITDVDVLKNIRSRDVIFYLSKKGWIKNREIAGSLIFDSPDGKLRVWVPLEGGLEEDYVLSMEKLLSSLSIFEDCSQIDIVENFDVITGFGLVGATSLCERYKLLISLLKFGRHE